MDYRRSSSLSRSLRDDDFDESDVWDVLNKDQVDFSGPGSVTYGRTEPVNSIRRRVVPSAATMIPMSSSGGCGSSNYSTAEPRIFQQSAPMNVSNWSGIGSKKNLKKVWEDYRSYGYSGGGSGDDNRDIKAPVDDDEEDETGYSSVIPPHEFLSRRLARSHISSLSVFEGVGRTLKGRDLSKVRNVVLTKPDSSNLPDGGDSGSLPGRIKSQQDDSDSPCH